MKCIKKGDEVVRVSDVEAAHRVKTNGWGYCAKSLYKSGSKVVKVEAAKIKMDEEAELNETLSTVKASGKPKGKSKKSSK